MTIWYPRFKNGKLQSASMADRKSSRASAANLRNIIRLIGLNETNILDFYDNAISDFELKKTLGKTEHLRWMAFSLMQENTIWKNPVKNKEFTKANQSVNYYRHATLTEWDKLPEIDLVFPDGKTFQEKDLEIIENLALIYREYNEHKTIG